MQSPRRKGESGWVGKVFLEIVAEIFPFFEQIPNGINLSKSSPRHIKVKFLKTKTKKKNLKSNQREMTHYL